MVVRHFDHPGVFFFKQLGEWTRGELPFCIQFPVVGDVFDEEQGKHLDAAWGEAEFLVEMGFDGAADHLAGNRILVDHAVGFAFAEEDAFSGMDFDF